jgi:PAS domain S-box-containing protein
VRAARSALGLFALPSSQFVEISSPAAELLGMPPERAVGLDYLDMVERRSEVATMFGLMSGGALDSVHANRRLRRADGSVVEVPVCARAIRSRHGSDLALWVAGDVVTGEERAAVTRALTPEIPRRLTSPEFEVDRPTVGTLDANWRVALLSTDVDDLLGYRSADLIGTSLIDITHPADETALLFACARATCDTNARVEVRLRHRDGTWRRVVAIVTLLNEGDTARFAFALATPDLSGPASYISRVAGLEESLRRIAVEVERAGVVTRLGATAEVSDVSVLAGLSARQLEVVTRLARGERVPAIASAMFLSQSTIRNHLSAVFRKLGVHTQTELMALLKAPRP